MASGYFFYFADLCPFADPFDRVQVLLFFLYLCRLLIVRLPLPILVASPCLLSMRSLPHAVDFPPVVPTSWVLSCFSSLTASLVDCSSAPLSLLLSISFRLGVCALLWGRPRPSCLLVLPLPPIVSSYCGLPPVRSVASYP